MISRTQFPSDSEAEAAAFVRGSRSGIQLQSCKSFLFLPAAGVTRGLIAKDIEANANPRRASV